jgi:hypothetical protein
VTVDGVPAGSVWASSSDEALEGSEGDASSVWDDHTETIFVMVCVQSVLTDEEDSETITVDPSEPQCEERDEHDWQSPIELVGGVNENPGVHGSGGGAIIHEVCLHCAAKKITDTWAQNPATGQEGFESVSYEDPDDDEIEALLSYLRKLEAS